MKFKEFFRTSFLLESPDRTTDPYGKVLDYDMADKSFLYSRKFYIYSTTEGIDHQKMIKLLQSYCVYTDNYKYPNEKEMTSKSGNKIVVKGDLTMLKDIFVKQEKINRNDLMQISYTKNNTLFVGRVWELDNIVSFWNGVKDFKKSKNKMLESFLEMLVDEELEDYTFEYMDFNNTVQTDIDIIRNPGKDSKEEKHQDYQSLPLHLMPPALKAQYMKQMGIKPKNRSFDFDRQGD